MTENDFAAPPFTVRADPALPRAELAELLRDAMQTAHLLETPAPAAAMRWIDTFLTAYEGGFETVGDALPLIAELRAEACIVPALDLEKLRNRQVLFFLDTVSQYVDDQAELRALPLAQDLGELASEFGLAPPDALWAVRMALTGRSAGPPLELLFPLLGHDRIMMRIGAVNSHLLHGRGLAPLAFGPGGAPFVPLSGTRPE